MIADLRVEFIPYFDDAALDTFRGIGRMGQSPWSNQILCKYTGTTIFKNQRKNNIVIKVIQLKNSDYLSASIHNNLGKIAMKYDLIVGNENEILKINSFPK